MRMVALLLLGLRMDVPRSDTLLLPLSWPLFVSIFIYVDVVVDTVAVDVAMAVAVNVGVVVSGGGGWVRKLFLETQKLATRFFVVRRECRCVH